MDILIIDILYTILKVVNYTKKRFYMIFIAYLGHYFDVIIESSLHLYEPVMLQNSETLKLFTTIGHDKSCIKR